MKNIADRALRVAIAIVVIYVVAITVGVAIPVVGVYASYIVSVLILVGVVTSLISISKIAESIDDNDMQNPSENEIEKPQYVCMKCGTDVESLGKCPKCGSDLKILNHLYKKE